MLARIGKWADLEMDDYVMVTSLCAVLAQQAHPTVHALLLDPTAALFAALKRVCSAYLPPRLSCLTLR